MVSKYFENIQSIEHDKKCFAVSEKLGGTDFISYFRIAVGS